MYRMLSRWTLAIGLLIAPATAARANTIVLDVTSDTQLFSVGTFTNVGWQFTVNAPITVDGLGLFDVNPAGLTESHQVGLWDDNGVLLASTTITSGSTLTPSASTAGDWLFNDVTPVHLVPGTYVTGGFYATSADEIIANATIATVPQISFLHSRASMQASFGEPGVYGLAEPGIFASNIRIEDTTAVPEPVSLLLTGSGLAILAVRRRRGAR